MEIEYKEIKDFKASDIQKLFLSVNWESGNYPEKLVIAMHNSTKVISAWDNDRLVGLVRALDDGQTIPFYARYGFQQYDNYSAMVLKHSQLEDK